MDRGIAVNELANRAGITPSTVYSLFDSKRKNVYIKTIKILCDGLNISLAEFFDADIFDDLEQEIK
ncbi:MAG: helix-turn-helix transcriptional regulator [Oscillospiraceae bacterium]|nr:helix-turn-helix transcriptional regulator [Oscillospiraceae bacterium]